MIRLVSPEGHLCFSFSVFRSRPWRLPVPYIVLAEINDVAQRAGSIAADDETAKLLDYAYACHQRSDGLFDITSGILRRIWHFKPGHLPEGKAIDDLLPRIGLAKVS